MKARRSCILAISGRKTIGLDSNGELGVMVLRNEHTWLSFQRMDCRQGFFEHVPGYVIRICGVKINGVDS